MSKTATFVKSLDNFTGSARLYLTSDQGYLAVSATQAFTSAETYIFPADSEGKVTDWLELDGSYRGGLDHEKALRHAGYEIV